jgi:FAD/FMN-containing dehydrogenase
MKSVRVDPTNRTARAEAGVLWQELDPENLFRLNANILPA